MDTKKIETNFENNVISLEALERIRIREIRIRPKRKNFKLSIGIVCIGISAALIAVGIIKYI
ncbi:MAG: hypothetical protein SOY04_00065 [Clostridium celatum]|nr:hypothetical protein [Clostridium celatum]